MEKQEVVDKIIADVEYVEREVKSLSVDLIEWSRARKDATPASPEKWRRLAKAEGRLQARADAWERTRT